MAFPAIPGEKFPGTVSAVVGVGLGISASIPKGSDMEKAAVRLLKYYYSPEVQQIKLETGAFIPTLKGVTSDKLEPFTTMMPKFYAGIAKTTYVLDGVLDANVCNNFINKGLQAHRPRHQDPGTGRGTKSNRPWRVGGQVGKLPMSLVVRSSADRA